LVTRFLSTFAAISSFFLYGAAAAADPDPEGTWYWAYQTGVMTDDRAAEALQPTRTKFVEQYLAGFILGYDRQIADSRFSIGAELQANVHFGDQGFYEFVVPISARYHPKQSWWGAFDSFAFGLGLSHYSEISELERGNYDGQSRRNLIYWYLEVEFAELKPNDNLFVRLHHRSNGYDTLEPNGGSNAIVVGFRRKF
jgi:hypothetical protein